MYLASACFTLRLVTMMFATTRGVLFLEYNCQLRNLWVSKETEMGFFRYCEKVSGFVGLETTLNHIHTVRLFWTMNKTIEEAVLSIRHANQE